MNVDRSGYFESGELWSLWDFMRDFEGWRFIGLASMLGEFAVLHPDNDIVIPDVWKSENLGSLRGYYPVLEHLAMDATQSSLEKLVALIEQPGTKFTDLGLISGELKGRLQDQAQKRLIFGLSSRESAYATAPRTAWDTAIARFPDIASDVDEAAFCLALSRYAASVYHSVQITEIGLMELGTFLKVNDPHSGWTSVANALEKVIDKNHADRSAFEKKHFASLE